jgi:hypothetical protein
MKPHKEKVLSIPQELIAFVAQEQRRLIQRRRRRHLPADPRSTANLRLIESHLRSAK